MVYDQPKAAEDLIRHQDQQTSTARNACSGAITGGYKAADRSPTVKEVLERYRDNAIKQAAWYSDRLAGMSKQDLYLTMEEFGKKNSLYAPDFSDPYPF